MTVIQATSAGVRDLADGSLRIILEFEPRHAKEAYALFGARGTACAVAALTKESTIEAAQLEAQEKVKPGPLCIMACNFCDDNMFYKWIYKSNFQAQASGEGARYLILKTCGIKSRKELDINPDAAAIFHQHIRIPFLAWKEKQ